jgi:hypothetical protein
MLSESPGSTDSCRTLPGGVGSKLFTGAVGWKIL